MRKAITDMKMLGSEALVRNYGRRRGERNTLDSSALHLWMSWILCYIQEQLAHAAETAQTARFRERGA